LAAHAPINGVESREKVLTGSKSSRNSAIYAPGTTPNFAGWIVFEWTVKRTHKSTPKTTIRLRAKVIPPSKVLPDSIQIEGNFY
jgi:hypothetical protein